MKFKDRRLLYLSSVLIIGAVSFGIKYSSYKPQSVNGFVGPYFNENKSPQTKIGRSISSVSEFARESAIGHYSFFDLAFVDTAPCSIDYSVIDNCYNISNPPEPSFSRTFKMPVPGSADMTTYPSQNYQSGRVMSLPHERSTNDGRLLLFRNTYNGRPSLSVFRPEALDYDFKVKDYSKKPTSVHVQIHPLVYYNPLKTSLSNLPKTGTSNEMLPNFFHFSVCDDSGAAYFPGPPSQISTRRNPVSCQARYNISSPYLDGDCYDISLMIAPDTSNHSDFPAKWEIRSSDITVFIPNAKSIIAANQANFGYQYPSQWIYPRQSNLSKLTKRTLPNYEDYHLDNLVNWETAVQDSKTACYDGRVRKANSPKWCTFFDHQDYSANGFDVYNFNSPVSSYFHWNGEQCDDPAKGCAGYFFFEPTITADGRLLVVNLMGSMAYSYNSKGACKASGWSKFDTIANMPYDSKINTRYAIGMNQVSGGTIRPFRDTSGNDIPHYVALTGAYGWIDREGKNLFYAQQNLKRDGYKAISFTGTPWSAEDPQAPYGQAQDNNPDQAPGKNVTILGAWTQGKMVIPDGSINFSDFGGRKANSNRIEYELALFDTSTTTNTMPAGSFSLLSFENQFNYFNALSPTLPFDVVWDLFSSNQANAQIVFDDYLMNNAFVVAHMNSPLDRVSTYPKDGFVSDGSTEDGSPAGFKFKVNPLLQNAATTHSFYSDQAITPPKELRLRGGARVEPMAYGGIRGKGVYLDGDNDFIDMGYPIPEGKNDWFLGIWLDIREIDPSFARTIYSFPEGSRVSISKNNVYLFNPYEPDPNQQVRTLPIGNLVQIKKYFHLGLKITSRGSQRIVKVFINGTPIKVDGQIEQKFTISNTNDPYTYGFQPFDNYLANGWTWFVVGDPGFDSNKPFKGWIDEFRMFHLTSNEKSSGWFDEFICNQALGTLVDVAYMDAESVTSRLTELRTSAINHGLSIGGAPNPYTGDEARGIGRPVTSTPVCEQMVFENYSPLVDFPSQTNRGAICIDKVHRSASSDPSLASRCVRTKKFGIDSKPLVPSEPRPDFSQVNFCLSCHSVDAKLPSLNLSALEYHPDTPRFRDARRQPLNVPASVRGKQPEGINWAPSGTIGTNAYISTSDTQRTLASPPDEVIESPHCYFQGIGLNPCVPMDALFDAGPKLKPLPAQ